MTWKPRIEPSRPVYQAIVSAIVTDLRAGRLREGDRLPAQRTLARTLGVNLTTVMRAIAEAQRRGLVAGRRGRGTYVQARSRTGPNEAAGSALADLTANLPPEEWTAKGARGHSTLTERLAVAVAELSEGEAARALLRYPARGGSAADRYAGQLWLERRGVRIDTERILVTSGADHALLLAVLALTQTGDTILVEDMTYPGFRAIAGMLGRRLTAVRSDTQGLDPDDLRAVCRAGKPALLFCCPTLQNPTATILSEERRKAVVSVARKHGLVILEDDVYGALPVRSPQPLAALAPECVVFVTSLSKCIAPGLRIGYAATADQVLAEKLTATVRATTWSPAVLTAAVAGRWIVDGTAEAALTGIRRENETRHEFAIRALTGQRVQSHPAASHLWLTLPRGWSRAAFVERARRNGVAVLGSDAFAVAEPAPEAVRVCLGAARDAEEARQAVARLAATLREGPGMGPSVV